MPAPRPTGCTAAATSSVSTCRCVKNSAMTSSCGAISAQGSQLQAQTYLLGAFQAASRANLQGPASVAAYRLGLVSLSGPTVAGARGGYLIPVNSLGQAHLMMLGKVVWPVVLPLGPPTKYSMPSETPSLS